jgi:protocatechuate 3,4-dioxygenase beta subunit
MKQIILIISLITIVHFAGCSQQPDESINLKGITTSESCEGCEAVYESPVPLTKLSWVDTLPDYNLAGPKLHIEGIVYHKDGETPAKNVVFTFIILTRQADTVQREMKQDGARGMAI